MTESGYPYRCIINEDQAVQPLSVVRSKFKPLLDLFFRLRKVIRCHCAGSTPYPLLKDRRVLKIQFLCIDIHNNLLFLFHKQIACCMGCML